MKRIKIYYCSTIRGLAGNAARHEEIDANLRKGTVQAARIRQIFGELVEVYCPHEHDRIIQILWRRGEVDTESILRADWEIQNDCDMTVANISVLSEGVKGEIENAVVHGQPVVQIGDEITDDNICTLINIIDAMIMNQMHRLFEVEDEEDKPQ